jgi:splicing factor 3A subunit 1
MAAPPQTNGASAKSVDAVLDEVSSQAPPGTVLPPKHIRGQMETIAGYVVRNGTTFEERLRNDPTRASKMSFLFPEDPYHAYYQWRVEEITAGRGTSVSAGRKEGEVAGGTGAGFQGREERKGPEKPEDFAFSARMPNISAQDLEVVKLTALFVAKNGRSWMTALSQKEAGNFQFDFLRPQHSLYQFFSRLVDQYTDLITGDSVDGGRPQKKRIVDLESNVADRFRILERAKKRAEWVKYQEAQKVQQEEAEEKEKIAYAQIDWHDFVVVETVVFDEDDEHRDLPAPTTLNDIQSLSLEQKGAISAGANMRIEEAVPDFDDIYNQAPAQPPPSRSPAIAQPQMPPPQQAYTATPPQQQPYAPPLDTSDQNAYNTLQADRARARAAQEAAKSNPSAANMKIRHNYVPAAQARNAQKASTAGKSICPNCHQLIANEEMEQHMRIEMLNPDWRDQYKVAQQRSSTTNLSTADVAANLKRLASQRQDVFDPNVSEAPRKRVEVDAPVQVQGGIPGAGEGTGEGKGVQEQIRLIHERAKKT